MKTVRSLFNPFYGADKADDIPFQQIKRLFVREASPIWEEARQPVNQIIRGPRGAGKTILLKHLSYLGSDTRNDYVGLYIQISRIANTFRHLFPKQAQDSRDALEHDYQNAFGDYLVLEIVKEIARTLEHLRRRDESVQELTDPEALLDGVATALSLQDVIAFCIRQQREIEKQSPIWELDKRCTWQRLFEPISTLNRISQVASPLLASHEENTAMYLLFDESAPIPVPCQEVVNSLLQRGRSFRTKLAIRPYEWQTLETYNGLRLEPGTDFKSIELVYPDELTDEYLQRARLILNRLLETKIVEPQAPAKGWPRLKSLDIEEIFPSTTGRSPRTYSGFRDICALSSSNPQNLVSICSLLLTIATEEGELPENGIPEVPRLLQHQAMVAWSKQQESTISDAGLLSFSRALLRHLSRIADRGGGLLVEVKNDSPSLFAPDYLPYEAAAVLKPGFALGFFRFEAGIPFPWDEVPSRFLVSRSLLPGYEISLRAGVLPELKLDFAFLNAHIKVQSGRSAQATDYSDKTLTLFLSTSFSDALAAERTMIKDALQVANMEFKPLEGDQFLFSSIHRQISKRDVTILNASEPRPYTLLELGLCAGLRKAKPVICVFNDNGQLESFAKLPEFLKVLPVVPFSCEPRRLAEMAAKVRRNAELLLSNPSEFEKVVLTGVSLRPKRAKRTLYVSHPDLPIWKNLIPRLREAAESKSFNLITEGDAPVYQANCLQVPIFCTSLATHVVIDTSGSSQPDLLQCYKLGVAIAQKRQVLRVEQKGNDHADCFSSIPISYASWREESDLLERILTFLDH